MRGLRIVAAFWDGIPVELIQDVSLVPPCRQRRGVVYWTIIRLSNCNEEIIVVDEFLSYLHNGAC